MAPPSIATVPNPAEQENFADPLDPLNNCSATFDGDVQSPGGYFIVCDCDGVLTDGSYFYDKRGKISKKYSVYDHDGYDILRTLLPIYFITSDKGEGLDIHWTRLEEFDPDIHLYSAPCGKRESFIVDQFGPLSNCIYIGDSWEDGRIIAKAAFGFAPASSMAAKYLEREGFPARTVVLECKGGEGVLFEVALWLATWHQFLPLNSHPILKG